MWEAKLVVGAPLAAAANDCAEILSTRVPRIAMSLYFGVSETK